MSLDFLPPLNLGTAAVLIFALCAGVVLLRGIGRLLLGTLVLSASVWLAFYVWQHTPAWSVLWLVKPNRIITTGLPVLTFVVAMVFIRKLLRFIASPLVKPSDAAPTAFTNVPMRLCFALVASAVLWLLGATLVHHAGSIAEIRSCVEKSAITSATSACLQRLKTAVEAVLPKEWLKRLDPLAEPARLALAKLIATQADPALPLAIDPATGKPYPRAILVDDPALQSLARQQDYATLLRHPNLTQALTRSKTKSVETEKDRKR
ncbi:MAG: hypothetical protein NTW21_36230 [Verrucomicrobia bacterium]|nr:hypothetical protein [Verrucomicrobiota bacterium]